MRNCLGILNESWACSLGHQHSLSMSNALGSIQSTARKQQNFFCPKQALLKICIWTKQTNKQQQHGFTAHYYYADMARILCFCENWTIYTDTLKLVSANRITKGSLRWETTKQCLKVLSIWCIIKHVLLILLWKTNISDNSEPGSLFLCC